MPDQHFLQVIYTRHIGTLWYLKQHPNEFGRVNGSTLNALKRRGWLTLMGDAGQKFICLTTDGDSVLNAFDFDAHPMAQLVFDGLAAKTWKSTKQATTPGQKRETKPKAATPHKHAIEAEIKPLPQSRREAVKEAAQMFISTPGVVVLTPQLINHPDIDSHTLGAIAWCASQTPAPTIEQVAKHLDMTPAFVRLLVKDVADAGFEMRVAL